MKRKPRQEEHFGRKVWVNPTTEAMREKECLCFNCGRMNPGKPDHCLIAQTFFGVCVFTGTAFAMTRCPEFSPKRKTA